MGVREQIIFPEIDYDAIDQVRGLDVTITTTAQTDAEAFALLEAFGMPFAKEGRPTRRRARRAARRGAAEAQARQRSARQGRGRARALEQLKEENPEAYERAGAEEPAEAETGDRSEETAMAKTSQRVRQAAARKFKTREYTRCRRCGRARSVYRKFGLCRICLREMAHNGFIPGMTKSSW